MPKKDLPHANGVGRTLACRLAWSGFCGLALLVVSALAVPDTVSSAKAGDYGFRVVRTYPHDPSAFTQGLVFHDGRLLESTGGYGTSTVRIVNLDSGRALREHRLANELFGEGLALAGGLLYQLTWKAGIGMVRDAETLEAVGEFRYANEGWGLAARDGMLVMSDGTSTLRFLDAASFSEVRRLQVRDGTLPVRGLNELEYVGVHLYANVWPTDRIAIIDPADGQVRGWLDLSAILPIVFRGPETDVLNGIAYDADTNRLFVTGKNWPRLFEIEVIAP